MSTFLSDATLPLSSTFNYDATGKYQDHKSVKRPVYQKVAAGEPHLMNEYTDKYFYLPQDLFKATDDIFLVQVKGDSMKDADINDGDLVVVEKRSSAQNREIVIVAINDESVIKRYGVMGDSVLLISENEAYEPIHVKTEQARVLGVVLGSIKCNSEPEINRSGDHSAWDG